MEIMEYQLCQLCAERHQKHPRAAKAKSPENCFICGGIFSQTEELCRSALKTAGEQKFEWADFSVQTTIPRKILVREEELFDEDLNFAISAKNQLNRIAGDFIANLSGKPYVAQNAQMIFRIDFTLAKARAEPQALFFFTRYRKLSRNYCQHLWVCGKCRGRGCKACESKGENYPSVEGAIKEFFAPAFGASDVQLHASGREDVDVITEGSGRPCIIEIIHPRQRSIDAVRISEALAKKHPIELLEIRACRPSYVESVCTSHFEKEYKVLIDAGRDVSLSEIEAIVARSPLMLNQRTPTRVAQRRADLVRKRRVLSMRLLSHSGSEFTLSLRTDAGTYIKEFVNGDNGRTVPSISSILNSPSKCKQLNVTHIYDDFVGTLA